LTERAAHEKFFTAASPWCGFSGTIGALIAARIVQGFGASLMTPQTVAIIFPPEGRGRAMGLWGAVAGLASLVGPFLGGALVGALGWQWIFFINLPIGIVAFVLAWRLVPRLETHPHHFDLLGVALSAIGMFLVVFSSLVRSPLPHARYIHPASIRASAALER
jgi:MFS family permease